jgi:hypothetical protein
MVGEGRSKDDPVVRVRVCLDRKRACTDPVFMPVVLHT